LIGPKHANNEDSIQKVGSKNNQPVELSAINGTTKIMFLSGYGPVSITQGRKLFSNGTLNIVRFSKSFTDSSEIPLVYPINNCQWRGFNDSMVIPNYIILKDPNFQLLSIMIREWEVT